MHSLEERRWVLFVAACGVLATLAAPALGAASAADKKNCKPGCDKNFAWQRIDFNAARKLEKPILLYIYDPLDGKASGYVKDVQLEILANSGVKKAFADFTPVMHPMCMTNWPAFYTSQAKNGVALVVMTCDAKPVAVFTHQNLPKVEKVLGHEEYPALLTAADAALKANPKALEAMRKSPPKDYVSPSEQAARREAAAQPPEPEKPTAAAANILEGGGKKDTKTADAPKKPEEIVGPKGTKAQEENE
jgi:hypothetical protein